MTRLAIIADDLTGALDSAAPFSPCGVLKLRRLTPEPGTLLVICGGATTQVVLGKLQIGMLALIGEALPGLPIARAGAFTLITKSGGFGDPDTLLRLLGPQIATRRESVGSHVG